MTRFPIYLIFYRLKGDYRVWGLGSIGSIGFGAEGLGFSRAAAVCVLSLNPTVNPDISVA